MKHANSNSGAARDVDEAHAWLAREHPMPPLKDRSLEGRRAFLDAHEHVLWAFFRDAFSLAYADGSLRPDVALGAKAGSNDEDNGAATAERLIEALRTRPTLAEAPGWTNIERWHGWLVGERATAARRAPRAQSRSTTCADAVPRGRSVGAAEDLIGLRRLVDVWLVVLTSVVTGTGIAMIEFDWLWATRHARKPLSDALADDPDYGSLSDVELDACVRHSSAPGSSPAERTRRSRAGACAAFRFNLEHIARRASPEATDLAAARRVFIGPAERSAPYYHPKLPIDGAASAGFWEVLQRSDAMSANAPGDGLIDRLWKSVLACGVNKSVKRLLPTAIAALVEDDDLHTLLAQVRAGRHGQENPT